MKPGMRPGPWPKGTRGICPCCGESRICYARGLCVGCYYDRKRAGTLPEPRFVLPRRVYPPVGVGG